MWYYTINGVQHGPVEEGELSAMLASGLIQGSTLVWKDGMEGWQALDRLPEWGRLVSGSGAMISPGYQPLPPTNGLAVASMVCGLASLVLTLSCWMGIFTAVPAVICGHLSLGQLRRTGFQQGRAFAITGLVTGYLIIALTLLVLLGIGAFIARDIV